MARRRRSIDERTIIEMFTYRRPRGSQSEAEFVERFLIPLGFVEDDHGNLILQIGENPAILWSSHMDTVHSRGGRQTVHYDGKTLSLTRRSKREGSSCLGADDTAGVWLMTEMVKAGVEGLYIIHYGEESGCIGSSELAKHPAFFDGIQAAIAFDRAGYEDVITHQTGRRTASDAFGRSLAGILGGRFAPSPDGVYTDTNEYADIIPECSNISVGYFRQHTTRETQDVPFLISLRDALVSADWSKLVIERDPSEVEYDDFSYYGSPYGSRSSSRWGSFGFGRGASSREDTEDLIKTHPDIVASLLRDLGVTRAQIMDEIAAYYGNSLRDDEEDEDGWERSAA